MKGDKVERLNENVTEKMCSLGDNGVGEMCSSADTDTYRNSVPFEQMKTRYHGKDEEK